MAPDDRTRSSLAALAAGDLASFHGLGPHDDRAAAESVFGPSEPGEDGVGPLMGVLTRFRRYLPLHVAPYGIVVWFAGDEVLLVEVQSPALDAAALLPLGEPEAVAPSGLAPLHDQLVWASRGLAAHVSRATGGILALFAFAPMTTDAFAAWLGEARGPKRVRRA